MALPRLTPTGIDYSFPDAKTNDFGRVAKDIDSRRNRTNPIRIYSFFMTFNQLAGVQYNDGWPTTSNVLSARSDSSSKPAYNKQFALFTVGTFKRLDKIISLLTSIDSFNKKISPGGLSSNLDDSNIISAAPVADDDDGAGGFNWLRKWWENFNKKKKPTKGGPKGKSVPKKVSRAAVRDKLGRFRKRTWFDDVKDKFKKPVKPPSPPQPPKPTEPDKPGKPSEPGKPPGKPSEPGKPPGKPKAAVVKGAGEAALRKTGVEIVGKSVAPLITKSMPFVAVGLGLTDMYHRWKTNDWIGMGMATTSTLLGAGSSLMAVTGVGLPIAAAMTASALALDVAGVVRDAYIQVYETDPATDAIENPTLVAERIGELTEAAWKALKFKPVPDLEGHMKEYYDPNTPKPRLDNVKKQIMNDLRSMFPDMSQKDLENQLNQIQEDKRKEIESTQYIKNPEDRRAALLEKVTENTKKTQEAVPPRQAPVPEDVPATQEQPTPPSPPMPEPPVVQSGSTLSQASQSYIKSQDDEDARREAFIQQNNTIVNNSIINEQGVYHPTVSPYNHMRGL